MMFSGFFSRFCRAAKAAAEKAKRQAQSESGSMAVEAALGVTFFAGVSVIVFDMHSVGLERTRLETSSGTIAQNVAVQEKLTYAGLDALVDAALETRQADTEIILMNVLQSGKVVWMLSRGDGGALCDVTVEGGYFTGTLPEDPPEEEAAEDEEDPSELSMVVVEACRRSTAVKLAGKMRLPGVMQVESIYRANAVEIELDEALQDENLIPDDDDEEDAA